MLGRQCGQRNLFWGKSQISMYLVRLVKDYWYLLVIPCVLDSSCSLECCFAGFTFESVVTSMFTSCFQMGDAFYIRFCLDFPWFCINTAASWLLLLLVAGFLSGFPWFHSSSGWFLETFALFSWRWHCSWSLQFLFFKNRPASAGDTEDTGSLAGWKGSPQRRKWQPTPVFLPGNSRL